MIFEKLKITILYFSKIRKFLNFKNVSENFRNLKCCNFFAIGPFLNILNVSESFGSLLSQWCTYFPDPLRETTSKVANPMRVRLGAARRAVGLDQISQ